MKQAVQDLTKEIRELHADIQKEAKILANRNRTHWRRIVITALITIYLSVQAADWHVTNCSFVGKPQSRTQQRICSFTTFWHDHPLER